MRFAFVVVAGLVGWLWYASREPAAPTSEPIARTRRADLSDLHAQVASAGRPAALPEIGNALESDDAVEADPLENIEAETRDADLGELAAQLARAEARAEEALTEDPSPDETIGHEVITIMGSAPIIDTATVSHCNTIETEYVRNIPVGRTFSAAIGGAADTVGDSEPVSFTGVTSLENTYYIEDVPFEDVPSEDVPSEAFEQRQHALEPIRRTEDVPATDDGGGR